MKKYKAFKKDLKFRYKLHHRLYDMFFYWFVGLHHPRKVLGAINYEHPHIKDYYGTLLSDDVEPAREQVKDFNGYVDCEAGDYLEVIVFNKNL